jgi:hypothetical protein
MRVSVRNIGPWFAAVVWIGLIYLTIPFVRKLRETFVAHWPAEFIGYTVMAVVVCAAATGLILLGRQQSRAAVPNIVWLIAVATIAVLWTRRLMGQPEEAVHFIEYGVLGILLFRALSGRVQDATVYAVVTLVGLLIGTVDELIQWLVPGRFWDLRDIVLNGGAVALIQVAIWRLAPPRPVAVNRSSMQLVCRLAAAEILLLLLCLSATPQRLARIAEFLPIPSRLATGHEAICEYGYFHVVDELTSFRSRLSAQDLARFDSQRSTDIIHYLDAPRPADASERETASPVTDPFLYEFRVHLFARNRNFNRARIAEPASENYRRRMTIAWRENLILETSFSQTLTRAARRWGPNRRRSVEAAQDSGQQFVSRVGGHLITTFSEGQLRALMLILCALFLLCDLLIATRPPRAAPPP